MASLIRPGVLFGIGNGLVLVMADAEKALNAFEKRDASTSSSRAFEEIMAMSDGGSWSL